MSKLLSLVLAVTLVSCLLPVSFSVSGAAAVLGEVDDTAVTVVKDTVEGTVTIGNGYIQRVISIANGKVQTAEIVNKRTAELMDDEIVLAPGEGSEDFILNVNNKFTDGADPVAEQLIRASDLTLAGEPQIKKSEDVTMVTFTFEPFVKYGIPWSVVYNVVMKDGDNFMNSFLAISVPEANKADAHIISIDLDAFKINGIDNS